MALLADGVSSLLIDGKLTSGGQGTFPTINPATEEVLGVAADADAEDMGRAIEAARRAFDDTDWPRNTELRVRCIRQLRDAMREHIEELREITIAEVGAPRMLTAAAQLEGPVGDLSFAANMLSGHNWGVSRALADTRSVSQPMLNLPLAEERAHGAPRPRSEERRVGKEC